MKKLAALLVALVTLCGSSCPKTEVG